MSLRTVKITLNTPAGADLGPNFTLSANTGSVFPDTATRSDLEAGYNITVGDPSATQITVTSTGICTNSITADILDTSTPLVFSTFYLSEGVLDSNGHCGSNYITGTPIYVEGEGTTPSFLLGKVAYTNPSLTTVFEGGALYYFVTLTSGSETNQFQTYTVIQINQFGEIVDIQDINCSNEGGSQL
jgi:hypothetical protein